MNGDGYGYDECRLQVVVPRSWKWSSLPDFCHRLPAIHTQETPTFKALVDHCWEIACGEVRSARPACGYVILRSVSAHHVLKNFRYLDF